jgi:hypothetical protein
VIIDDHFPFLENKLVGNCPQKRNKKYYIWACLIEKAIAKDIGYREMWSLTLDKLILKLFGCFYDGHYI